MYGNNETHEGVEAMEKDITTSKRMMDMRRFYYCILGHALMAHQGTRYTLQFAHAFPTFPSYQWF